MLIVIIQELFSIALIKVLLKNNYVRLFDCFFVLITIGVSYALYSSLQVYLSVLIVLFCGCYAYYCNRNFSKTVMVVMETFIISIIIDHISHITVQFIRHEKLYLAVYCVIQVVVIYIIARILKKNNLSTTFDEQYLNRYTASLLVVVYFYIIKVEGWKNDFDVLFSNLVMLLVMICLLLILYNEYLKNVKTKYEVQKQQSQMKNDARYMAEIETHYNELRRFRHEYQNMLISIDEYLKTDDLKGLQSYYHSNLEPVSEQVLKDKYSLEDISRIKIKSIKSIFFNKLSYAQSQGVETHFESKEELTTLDVKELDVVIALGIILDNAIEASVGYEGSEIMSGIFITEKNITFVVQNNLYEDLPPVWQLKQPGFSTKGEGRGLGLDSLSKLVGQNENMVLETRSLENVFLQRLTVKRIGNND